MLLNILSSPLLLTARGGFAINKAGRDLDFAGKGLLDFMRIFSFFFTSSTGIRLVDRHFVTPVSSRGVFFSFY